MRAALGVGDAAGGDGLRDRGADARRDRRGARTAIRSTATSLTEDYELGLRIAERGGRAAFVRVRDDDGAGWSRCVPISPGRIDAAVRQKARWMTGIALAGWDRTGWARWHRLCDHWMRMRDRRAPLAVIVLGAAYAALVLWGIAGIAAHAIRAATRAPSAGGAGLAGGDQHQRPARSGGSSVRMTFTGRAYGWREACWSVPRFVVGNIIALMAARRALIRYVAMLRGGPTIWDKTPHVVSRDAGQPVESK